MRSLGFCRNTLKVLEGSIVGRECFPSDFPFVEGAGEGGDRSD